MGANIGIDSGDLNLNTECLEMGLTYSSVIGLGNEIGYTLLGRSNGNDDDDFAYSAVIEGEELTNLINAIADREEKLGYEFIPTTDEERYMAKKINMLSTMAYLCRDNGWRIVIG